MAVRAPYWADTFRCCGIRPESLGPADSGQISGNTVEIRLPALLLQQQIAAAKRSMLDAPGLAAEGARRGDFGRIDTCTSAGCASGTGDGAPVIRHCAVVVFGNAITSRMLVVPTDVADAASIAALFDTVRATYGRIDLLFNNAGIGEGGPVSEVPLTLMKSNFETNVFAPLALTQLALPQLRVGAAQAVKDWADAKARVEEMLKMQRLNVGFSRATTRAPRGFRFSVNRLIVPPLPAASRPSPPPPSNRNNQYTGRMSRRSSSAITS